jgi:hypothetical protein
MPSHNQNTVDYVSSDYSKGGGSALSTHGTESLQKNFPGSPIHDGSLSRESIQEMGNELLLSAVINDGGHTFGEQGRDYSGAPNFDDVKTGGGGLPGSAFTPNTASPGEGSMNATDLPAPPDQPDPGTEFGSGAAGIARKPSELSAGIAKHTLKDYGLGKRAGE